MDEGAPAWRLFVQFMVRGGAMGVQPEPAHSPHILVPSITGLDPFKAMVMSVAAAKHLRRRQRQGGASMTTLVLVLLWICKNGRAGRKRETMLQRPYLSKSCLSL